MANPQILVVDDEPDIRELVQDILIDEGFDVNVAENALVAKDLIQEQTPDLILLDIWMPDIDGISLLKELKTEQQLYCPIIMMSGHGNVETAVEATRYGAYDFIEKPLSLAKLLITVKQALESDKKEKESKNTNYSSLNNPQIIGHSQTIELLRTNLKRIAKSNSPVLIHGEFGTDKELMARYIHYNSDNANAPFIHVNVASLNESNSILELTGEKGLFSQVGNGTLFLRDIADLNSNLQSFLVTCLANKSYSPQGSNENLPVQFRLISATRINIEEHIKLGSFNSELYYFMNVLPLSIPPLREHYEDIPELLEFYVNEFVDKEGLSYRKFNVAAQNKLRSYDWPGNLRELKNLVQRLLIVDNNEPIDIEEVELALNKEKLESTIDYAMDFDLPMREAREKFERAYLLHQLNKMNGSVSKVANAIGMERTHLYRKIKSLGITLK